MKWRQDKFINRNLLLKIKSLISFPNWVGSVWISSISRMFWRNELKLRNQQTNGKQPTQFIAVRFLVGYAFACLEIKTEIDTKFESICSLIPLSIRPSLSVCETTPLIKPSENNKERKNAAWANCWKHLSGNGAWMNRRKLGLSHQQGRLEIEVARESTSKLNEPAREERDGMKLKLMKLIEDWMSWRRLSECECNEQAIIQTKTIQSGFSISISFLGIQNELNQSKKFDWINEFMNEMRIEMRPDGLAKLT